MAKYATGKYAKAISDNAEKVVEDAHSIVKKSGKNIVDIILPVNNYTVRWWKGSSEAVNTRFNECKPHLFIRYTFLACLLFCGVRSKK